MWVSRKEFDKLREELESLKRRHESHVSDVVACRNFTVYGTEIEYVSTTYGIHERRKSQQLSLKDAVQRILDRLGIELVYVEGKPAEVALRPKKKAA